MQKLVPRGSGMLVAVEDSKRIYNRIYRVMTRITITTSSSSK